MLRRPAFWDGGDVEDPVRRAVRRRLALGARRRPSTIPAWSVGGTVTCSRAAEPTGDALSTARLLADVARRAQPGACRRHAGAAGRRHGLGAALARHRGAGRVYAADRQAKGFNAVLLMTVQPDMRAVGPRDRTARRRLRRRLRGPAGGTHQPAEPRLLPVPRRADRHPAWSTTSSRCCSRSSTASAGRVSTSPGPVVPPDEYARYCRYLVARYGARPAIYLVGADGTG